MDLAPVDAHLVLVSVPVGKLRELLVAVPTVIGVQSSVHMYVVLHIV